jgi:hypothetical protein
VVVGLSFEDQPPLSNEGQHMGQAPSGHSILAAIRFHQEHAPEGARMVVPPPGAWENWNDAVVVETNGQAATMFDAGSVQCGQLDATIPYDEPGCLIVSYLYRDASNYKYRGSCAIAGPIDRVGLGWLLAALTGGDEGGFIPSQIGMRDLQPTDSLDFDGDDHVWHELEGIGWRSLKVEADTTWDDVRPLAEARALVGYDVAAALAAFDNVY